MNGGHDLGGKQGLGAINPEAEDQEPVFHSEWEKRVFALTLATGMLGQWTIDESRHARENQHPAKYLQNSYYENWLEGLEALLLEKELISSQELATASIDTATPTNKTLRVPNANDAAKLLALGGPSLLPANMSAGFAVGDRVRVKRNYQRGHTRAPNYAQGVVGTIANHWGSHVFPDRNAAGSREGEHLYSVLFTADSLWGNDLENNDVLIDLWQPYLEKSG